jgi:thioester reductase-like protein
LDLLEDERITIGGHLEKVVDVNDILVTGASGFLGAYLVAQLLLQTNAHIYCIIRCRDGEALSRLKDVMNSYELWSDKDETRITCLKGDLSEQQLGLSQGIWSSLACTIDAVVHCGATVNWLLSYEQLRNANILGTVEILKLATLSKLKQVHYISSIGIATALEREIRMKIKSNAKMVTCNQNGSQRF